AERFENQKATVQLNQFAIGQDRYLFLRCLVNDAEPEVARVKVSYIDELEGGADRTADGVVRIKFTDDKTLHVQSMNSGIVAEKELMLTAVTKDEALASADAGNYREAAAKLDRQADALDSQYQYAAPSVQIQIQHEAQNLRDRSQQLQKNEYDSSFRK